MKADTLLDEAALCHFLGVGRSRLHELMREPWFPKPLRIMPTNKKYWTSDDAAKAREAKAAHRLPRNTKIANTGRRFASLLQQIRLGKLTRKQFDKRFCAIIYAVCEHKTPEEFAEQGGLVYDLAPYIQSLLPDLEANRAKLGDAADSLRLLLP